MCMLCSSVCTIQYIVLVSVLVVLEIAAGILGFVFRDELVRDGERYIVPYDIRVADWFYITSLSLHLHCLVCIYMYTHGNEAW